MTTATTMPGPGVTEAQIRDYHDKGFLVLRAVFSHEDVEQLADEAAMIFARTDLIDKNNIRCRWKNNIDTDECSFDCFDPVIDLGPVCARVARDPRIMRAVGALYGETACLFKDKLIFKQPGIEGYALHQDYISWKSFPKSFLTVIVAIAVSRRTARRPTDRTSGGACSI
jgi:hypothetical protein